MRFVPLAMIAVLCAAGATAGPTVSSIFREPVKGEIVKLDDQDRLEIKIEGSEVPERIRLDEVVDIDFGVKGDERRADKAPLRIYLVNGDVLYGSTLDGPDGDDELFYVESARLGKIAVSIEHVKRIEVVSNVKPGVLPELEDGAEHDCAYSVIKGGSRMEADPDAELMRVVKDGLYVYNDLLHSEIEEPDFIGERLLWSSLYGIVCNRSKPTAAAELFGIFTLRDGTVVRGVIKKWEGGKVAVKHTVLGIDVEFEESNLMSVTMKNGRYVYLSDLEFSDPPEERPYYLPGDFDYDEYMFKVKRDRAQGGGPLSIRGKVFAKGFGVHALSTLKFDLNKEYRRLIADIGVDDSAGDLASVEFKVYGDGKLLYESGVVRRSANAKKIDIEVLNVNELVLEVTAADNADIQDRANWANIKVVR